MLIPSDQSKIQDLFTNHGLNTLYTRIFNIYPNLLRQESIIFLYEIAPKFLLKCFKNNLEITKIESDKLKKISSKLEKIEKRVKFEEEVNNRVMHKFWLERNKSKNGVKRVKERAKGFGISIQHKYSLALLTEIETPNKVSRDRGIPLQTIQRWVKKIPYYKRILDINPIFGALDWEVSELQLKKYQIGKYAEMYGEQSALLYFGCSSLELDGCLHWYKNEYGKLEKIALGYGDKRVKARSREMENKLDGDGEKINIYNNNTKEEFSETNQNIHLKQEELVDSNITDIIPNLDKSAELRDKHTEEQVHISRISRIEQEWAIVILNKYLNFTPDELKILLGLSYSSGIEKVLRMYENEGIEGLIEFTIGKYDVQKPLKEVARRASQDIGDYMEQARKNHILPQTVQIYKYLHENGHSGVTRSNIQKIMNIIGYKYKKMGVRSADKTKAPVIKKREEYFKRLYENRNSDNSNRLEEVYQDESFIIDRNIMRYSWVKDENNNVEMHWYKKYHQICICAAINQNGWVGVNYNSLQKDLLDSENCGVFKSGGILYFRVKNPEEKEVHLSFNKELFLTYFQNQLIPSLSKPSLIILDQCTYHTPASIEDFNPKIASKANLIEYLLERNIESGNNTKKELRNLAISVGSRRISYLENSLNKTPHSLLFLPPYHPELNPIEICWGILKKPILNTSTMIDPDRICREQLPRRFSLIDSTTVRHVYDRLEKVLLEYLADFHSTSYNIQGGKLGKQGSRDGEKLFKEFGINKYY